mmetsp:Transcript_4199/g.11145  ORF Transcript_4199/g.11145 Transcript_4199/m.11145 type:complete len:386 (-) Transcript_4199:751-1908(-)
MSNSVESSPSRNRGPAPALRTSEMAATLCQGAFGPVVGAGSRWSLSEESAHASPTVSAVPMFGSDGREGSFVDCRMASSTCCRPKSSVAAVGTPPAFSTARVRRRTIPVSMSMTPSLSRSLAKSTRPCTPDASIAGTRARSAMIQRAPSPAAPRISSTAFEMEPKKRYPYSRKMCTLSARAFRASASADDLSTAERISAIVPRCLTPEMLTYSTTEKASARHRPATRPSKESTHTMRAVTRSMYHSFGAMRVRECTIHSSTRPIPPTIIRPANAKRGAAWAIRQPSVAATTSSTAPVSSGHALCPKDCTVAAMYMEWQTGWRPRQPFRTFEYPISLISLSRSTGFGVCLCRVLSIAGRWVPQSMNMTPKKVTKRRIASGLNMARP